MLSRNYLLPVLYCTLAAFSCTRDAEVASIYNGFPVDVGQIMIERCATPGCHNDNSFYAEGRFSAASWEMLFKGSNAGAVVIPYRADQSFLTYFINTDSSLGPVQLPQMPVDGRPLSREEYLMIRDWINAGAPDINGKVKFADKADRKKIYVANQGCDLVAVIDYETGLIMRYVDVGQVDGGPPEAPHNLKVSPDGKYWYVVFISSNYIEKYSTATDEYMGRIYIGEGDWNVIVLSNDGKYAFCVSYPTPNVVAIANLETMTATDPAYSVGSKNIHGAAINADGTRLYLTQQDQNGLFFMDFTGDPLDPANVNLDEMDLVQGVPAANGSALKPHEVAFTPDYLKFAVTCQYANEVRFYDAATQDLLEVIQVGTQPVEMTYAGTHPYLFVTCMEDTTLFPGDDSKRGSVAVINYNTMSLVSSVYTGYQPHGLACDNEGNMLYVANRNTNPFGPAPHHSSVCGGRNGYLTRINMGTLELDDTYRPEMSVDPYAVGIRY